MGSSFGYRNVTGENVYIFVNPVGKKTGGRMCMCCSLPVCVACVFAVYLGLEGGWWFTGQIPTHNLNLIGPGLTGWGQNGEKISHINQDKIIS